MHSSSRLNYSAGPLDYQTQVPSYPPPSRLPHHHHPKVCVIIHDSKIIILVSFTERRLTTHPFTRRLLGAAAVLLLSFSLPCPLVCQYRAPRPAQTMTAGYTPLPSLVNDRPSVGKLPLGRSWRWYVVGRYSHTREGHGGAVAITATSTTTTTILVPPPPPLP